MPTPFGPQLIGETEKTLNAILRGALAGTGVSEPQWVTLRLAAQLDLDPDALATALAERAHFDHPGELVNELTRRGLLDDGRPSLAGRELIAAVQADIATTTSPIWDRLPPDDVAATERLLNEVVTRARAALTTTSTAT